MPGNVWLSCRGSPIFLWNTSLKQTTSTAAFASDQEATRNAVANRGAKNITDNNKATFLMKASSYYPVRSKSLDYRKRKAPEEP
jgi:hypothetical protein